MKQAPIIPVLKFQNSSLPFNVQSLKDFEDERNDIHEGPHSHNYYEMIWLINGNGVLRADMQEHAVKSHTIFCLRPYQPHQCKSHSELEGFVFSFTDAFFKMDDYDFSWSSQPVLSQLFTKGSLIEVNPMVEKDMQAIVLKMIQELENNDAHQLELLKRYFKIFLIYLTRGLDENVESTEQSRKSELTKNFMELLDKNYKEMKSVSEYAGQLLVTANYLNRIVKQHTGYSAGHHIRQRVVLEAKRMSRYSGAAMKEIAYDLGFLDTAHFSRFFKAFGGKNFSDFKRETVVVPFNQAINRA
jgi:YesN/AraC family two-component response regulator